MNDFIHYSARMENAGIYSLWVSLGHDKDGWRLMHVSPSSSVPSDVARRFPTRTFRIDGSDPVLQQLKDDIAYGDEITPDQFNAICLMNLQQAEDLREWYADWQAMDKLEESDLSEPPIADEQAHVDRIMAFTKGMMRGMDAKREHEASKIAAAREEK